MNWIANLLKFHSALILAGSLLISFSALAVSPYLPVSVSTIPSNGDENPYGVVFVPEKFCCEEKFSVLEPGDILVSNFNNSNNLQGTGTTIVRLDKNLSLTTFFTTPNATLGGPGTGLTTALEALKSGFVVVGSLPSVDGTLATASPGSLLVIDANGSLNSSITDPLIDGPWDMTAIDHDNQVVLFVSNALNGTVIRIELCVDSQDGVIVENITQIASGYSHRADPVAFVLAPTGLVYDKNTGILYVASTEDNAIFAVSNARTRTTDGGTGSIIYSDNAHLHGPLGMIEAPNGNLLVANGDAINSDPTQPSEIVEFTKSGQFVTELSIDPALGGPFGLNIEIDRELTRLAAVDNNINKLIIYRFWQAFR